MWKGVNGDAPSFFNRSANDRTNYIATNKPLVAKRLTHPTVVDLLQKNAMYAAHNYGQTSSITSHKINNPAIYKSEFVMLPLQNNYFT